MYQIRLCGNKTKQNKARKPGQSGPKKKRSSKVQGSAISAAALSECARTYFDAIARPFSETARKSCLPTFPSVASQKVSAVTNGVARIGTNNLGFITVSPCLAGNVDAIYHTNALSNSTAINVNSLDNVGISSPSLPYAYSQLVDGNASKPSSIRGRLISVGLRIRYIGTELNLGGRMVGYVSPTHSNLNGATYHDLASRSEAVRMTVSREWSELVVYANTTDEMEYPGHVHNTSGSVESLRSAYPLSNYEFIHDSLSQTGGAPMAFMFTGEAGNEFEFEVVTHCEYVGPATAGMTSESHCDVIGTSRVQNAAGQVGLRRAGTSARDVAKSMTSAFLEFAYANRETIVGVARIGSQLLTGQSARRRIGN